MWSLITTVVTLILSSIIAAATVVYVMLVHKQCRVATAMLRSQIIWRLLEEVYKPLFQELGSISDPKSYGVDPPKLSWEAIKNRYPHLAYLIPKRLRDELDGFSSEYAEFTKKFRGIIGQLVDALKSKGCMGIPSVTVRKCYDLPYETVSLLYFIRNKEAVKELIQRCRKGAIISINYGTTTKDYRDIKEATKEIEELTKVAKPIIDKTAPQLEQITGKANKIHNKIAEEIKKNISEIEKVST